MWHNITITWMPWSTSLINYFQLLPWDLTKDYIRQVLCFQSKRAHGNEVCHTFISQKWMVSWSAPAAAAEWKRLWRIWLSFWNFSWQSRRKSLCQAHTWLVSGWSLSRNDEVSKQALQVVISVWTCLISLFSWSAHTSAAAWAEFHF